jgi:lipopolysaccharide transport system permease protein
VLATPADPFRVDVGSPGPREGCVTVAASEALGQVASPFEHERVRVTGPWQGGVVPRFAELWRHRSLVPWMGKEFIVKRYRATYLGLLWIPLRPGMDIITQTFIFGGVLQVASGDRPYFIFIAFGRAGWMIFDRSMHWSARSVRFSSSVARGLHCPRMLIQAATIFPTMMDFFFYMLIALIGLFYFLLVRGHWYLAPAVQMPVGFLGLFVMILYGIAVGLFIAPIAGNTKEVRYVLTYFISFLYFVTPIVKPLTHLHGIYYTVALWNPLTAPIEMVNYGFLGTNDLKVQSVLSSAVALVAILLTGLWFQSRFERAAVARL